MKRALTSATVMTAILAAATIAWAGGMGGGMGGGMMGGSGHMMDSYGYGQMGPGQRSGGDYDRDQASRPNAERQRAREAYDRNIRRLDREIGRKEQALKDETRKERPNTDRIEKLHHELSDLEQRYDDRRYEFESRWGQDYR